MLTSQRLDAALKDVLPAMPDDVLNIVASGLCVRDVGRVAICCRRLRRAMGATVNGLCNFTQFGQWAKRRSDFWRPSGPGCSAAPIAAAFSMTQLGVFLDRGSAVSAARRKDLTIGLKLLAAMHEPAARAEHARALVGEVFWERPDVFVGSLADEDQSVREATVELILGLRCPDGWVDAHGSKILAHMQHAAAAVRSSVMIVLNCCGDGKIGEVLGTLVGLEPAALAAQNLDPLLHHHDAFVRVAVFHLMAGIGQKSLHDYTRMIASWLEGAQAELRYSALLTLTLLEPAAVSLAGAVVSKLAEGDDRVRMAAFEVFRRLPDSTRAAHGGSNVAIALADRHHFEGGALLDFLPGSAIGEHETAIAALLHDTSADPRLRLSVFYALDRFDSEKYIPDFITLLADPDDGNYDCNEVFEILDAKEPAVLEKHSDALLAMVHVSPAARGPRADAALQARGHRRRAGSDRRRRAARESLERENRRVAGVRMCAEMLLAKFMPEFAEFA